jgi:hypothetical protein
MLAAVVAILLAAADWIVGEVTPSRELGSGQSVYFEWSRAIPKHARTTLAELKLYPGEKSGPWHVLPALDSLTLEVTVIVDFRHPATLAKQDLKKHGESLITKRLPPALYIHLPKGTYAVVFPHKQRRHRFLTNEVRSEYDYKAAPYLSWFTSHHRKPTVHLGKRLVKIPLNDFLVYGHNRDTHGSALYDAYIFVRGLELDRTGLASSTLGASWDPNLQAYSGLRRRMLPGAFVVTACECGLRAAAPQPSAKYPDSIEWTGLDVDSPVDFAVSLDTRMSEVLSGINFLLVPAIIGLCVSLLFEWRVKEHTSRSSYGLVPDGAHGDVDSKPGLLATPPNVAATSGTDTTNDSPKGPGRSADGAPTFRKSGLPSKTRGRPKPRPRRR